jgi:ATP-binding cassette subfamily D (ALD) protein 4
MLPAFKNLFNYLTGSEIDVDEKRTKPIKAEPIKFFLKYLVKICRLLFPSIISPSTLTFLALLIDVVVLEVVIYRVGLISGKYYKCLSDRDLSAFWSLTINAILYIIVNSVLKSLKDFLASLLSIIWRKCLTQKLHESYFTRMRFYYLQLNHADYDHEPQLVINENVGSENRIILNEANSNKLNKLDNPDQRITQDVNSLCVSFSSIIPLLLITPFVIGWYGYKVSY